MLLDPAAPAKIERAGLITGSTPTAGISGFLRHFGWGYHFAEVYRMPPRPTGTCVRRRSRQGSPAIGPMLRGRLPGLNQFGPSRPSGAPNSRIEEIQ